MENATQTQRLKMTPRKAEFKEAEVSAPHRREPNQQRPAPEPGRALGKTILGICLLQSGWGIPHPTSVPYLSMPGCRPKAS